MKGKRWAALLAVAAVALGGLWLALAEAPPLAPAAWLARGILQRAPSGASQEKGVYYCPMHPTYTSDRPGDCPICSMKLVKRGGEHEHAAPTTGGPEGYAAVLISPQKRQLIGVKTAPAEKRRMVRTIRTVGRVLVDETRIVHVHPKVEGWAREIYARYEGDAVRKGQPLFSFYSPDFITVQQEYLSALELVAHSPAGVSVEVAAAAQANLEAARQRLLWWDVSEEQIQELEKRGKPSETLVLVSPMDGIVLRKHVWSGEFMERGGDFYHIADLSTLWVDADLYEQDLPHVSVGQEAAVVLSQAGQGPFRGKVIYVSPTVNMETRTATARLEFPNPDGQLRPGQYATAQIEVDLGERLAVPAQAVLDTGVRKILFVSKENGLLEPRSVEVGVRAGDDVEVTRGVSEGEQVVTSGNFLIDSESRLQGALQGMGSSAEPGKAEHRHGP